MSTMCLYVLFNNKREPLVAGVMSNGNKTILNLYNKGSGTTIYELEENRKKIAKAVNDAIANDVTILTSDFKEILASFPIIRVQNVDYKVYDCRWATTSDNRDIDCRMAQSIVSKMLDRLSTAKPRLWQKVFANAAVVYQDLEERGVIIGMIPHKPIWAQSTYSGRSKNLVVNIQGADGTSELTNPACIDSPIYVYFDWIAADIRVASIISGDKLLQNTFIASDPYTSLRDMLTTDEGTIERDNCKLQLLQAINSFDFNHPIFDSVFVDLGNWLMASKQHLDDNGWLASILGRKFRLSDARNNNPLAVLNGVLQGSVAHAIQLTIKRIWDTYGTQLLVETHDSVAITSKPEHLRSLINNVSSIMSRPFAGVIDDNPYFPLKVSVGSKFREWKPIRIYRESGMEKLNA